MLGLNNQANTQNNFDNFKSAPLSVTGAQTALNLNSNHINPTAEDEDFADFKSVSLPGNTDSVQQPVVPAGDFSLISDEDKYSAFRSLTVDTPLPSLFEQNQTNIDSNIAAEPTPDLFNSSNPVVQANSDEEEDDWADFAEAPTLDVTGASSDITFPTSPPTTVLTDSLITSGPTPPNQNVQGQANSKKDDILKLFSVNIPGKASSIEGSRNGSFIFL